MGAVPMGTARRAPTKESVGAGDSPESSGESPRTFFTGVNSVILGTVPLGERSAGMTEEEGGNCGKRYWGVNAKKAS